MLAKNERKCIQTRERMPKVLEFGAILGAPDRGRLGGFDLLYQHRPKRSRTNEDELLLEKGKVR